MRLSAGGTATMNSRASLVTAYLACALAACSGRTGHGITKAKTAVANQQKPVTVRPPEDVITSSVPLMPRAVTSFGAAVLGDAVYTLGGYSGRPHAYSREGQSGELWRLSLRDGTWTQLASSEPAQGTPVVALGPVLMRAGGMRAL